MQPSNNAAWLDLTQEETLEPDLPIIDPHHHLWDARGAHYVQQRYLMDEMAADMNSGHNIVATVFIECGTMFRANGPEHMRCVGETEFVGGIAAMSASGAYGPTRIAKGIVGTAPLRLGDKPAAEALDAQIVAGNGRFRGIRVGATWDASPEVENHRTEPPKGMYADATFRAGFQHLAPRNLTFEAWCYHTQIPGLTELAKAFPDTTIILDHFGGPIGVGPYAGKEDEVFAAWRTNINELAQCPNVMAKLGGLVMPVNGFGWQDQPAPPSSQVLMERTRRYYEHTIDIFGANRCMFESNFPVDKVACSYNVLWNSFKRLTADYSAAEKAALYHDTAARVYPLG
jgi:L-fuconolactonase